MTRRLCAVAVLFSAMFALSCDEGTPTAPTQVNVNVNQTVNLGSPLPSTSPSPVPGSVDKTIVAITVTEIGGDGLKQFAVGEHFTLTMTPRNAAGADPCQGFPDLTSCGAYNETDPHWFAGTGVGSDCTSSTAIVCDLGPSQTNFNRSFRALRAGSFTVNGQFRSVPPASFTGTVQ